MYYIRICFWVHYVIEFIEGILQLSVPSNNRIVKKAGKLLDDLRELVYPDSYDPTNPPKKRPAPSAAPAAKRAKPDAKSVEDMAKEGKVSKELVSSSSQIYMCTYSTCACSLFMNILVHSAVTFTDLYIYIYFFL